MSRTDFWPAHTITVLEHLVAGVVRTDADVQPLVVDLLEADPGKLLHALRGERPGGLAKRPPIRLANAAPDGQSAPKAPAGAGESPPRQ